MGSGAESEGVMDKNTEFTNRYGKKPINSLRQISYSLYGVNDEVGHKKEELTYALSLVIQDYDRMQDQIRRRNLQIKELKTTMNRIKGKHNWNASDWEHWATMVLENSSVPQSIVKGLLPEWFVEVNR